MSGVQRQHVQVSAAGEVDAAHVGALLQVLARCTSIPPVAFAARETHLVRSDDESSAELELSDTQWSNVRRARAQTLLSVYTEGGRTEHILYLPPSPPSANPICAVRAVVLMEDLTPTSGAAPPDAPLDPNKILATHPTDYAAYTPHKPNWHALIAGLNWTPKRETLRSGLRYVFVSADPLVLHELRVFRAHGADDDVGHIYVRALSTFRSDVGAQVPKHAQDQAARALQYAQQHMHELQRALGAVVHLDRDA